MLGLLLCHFFLLPPFLVGQAIDVYLVAQTKPLPKGFNTHYRLHSISLVDSLLITISNQLHRKGYLDAYIDAVHTARNEWQVDMAVGKIYRSKLKFKPIYNFLQPIAKKFRHFYGEPYDGLRVAQLMDKAVQLAQNNGYPFASMQLDTITKNGNYVSGVLLFDPSLFIRYDSLRINDYTFIKSSFLEKQLHLKRGDVFRQKNVDKIATRIDEIPYLALTQPVTLGFKEQKAILGLSVEKKKVGKIDGLVGLLPNSNMDNRVRVTGELLIDLYNPFRTGKHLEISWRRYKPRSQTFKLLYEHPKLLNTFLDVTANVNLLTEDTLFRNVALATSITKQYKFGKVSIYLQSFTSVPLSLSRLIRFNEQQIPQRKSEQYSIGLAFEKRYLDNYTYPSNGWEISIKTSIGKKNITQAHKNSVIDTSLVAHTAGVSIIGKIYFNYKRYIKLTKLFNVDADFTFSHLLGKQLLLSEQFRIGGINSIRGFNENQFFASTYALLNLAYRIRLQNDSFIYLFADNAKIITTFADERVGDFVFGTGLGFNIQTTAGILNLAYALGKSKDQQFSPTFSKIHFGYVNRF